MPATSDIASRLKQQGLMISASTTNGGLLSCSLRAYSPEKRPARRRSAVGGNSKSGTTGPVTNCGGGTGMGWRKKRVLKTQQPAKSMTEFFVGHARNTEYVFSVTMIPRVENRVRKDGGIWSGSFVMITLLNLSRKTYFFAPVGPPIGWEYIAEKYELEDEEAVGFAEIIGRVLGREVRLTGPDLPEFLPRHFHERCLRVIPGGRANG